MMVHLIGHVDLIKVADLMNGQLQDRSSVYDILVHIRNFLRHTVFLLSRSLIETWNLGGSLE